MNTINKENMLYLKGPVILNSISDTHGDNLNRIQIKTLFAAFKKHRTDIHHSELESDGVYVIGNYITEIDTILEVKVAGQIIKQFIPAGSWMMEVGVENQAIISKIRRGELRGFSLSSYPISSLRKAGLDYLAKSESLPWQGCPNGTCQIKDILGIVKEEINRPTYSDFDINDIQPFFISLVEHPANRIYFEVSRFFEYIRKSTINLEVKIMALEDQINKFLTNESIEKSEKLKVIDLCEQLVGVIDVAPIEKKEEVVEEATETQDDKGVELNGKEIVSAIEKGFEKIEGTIVATINKKDSEGIEKSEDKESAKKEKEAKVEESDKSESEKEKEAPKDEKDISQKIDEVSKKLDKFSKPPAVAKSEKADNIKTEKEDVALPQSFDEITGRVNGRPNGKRTGRAK